MQTLQELFEELKAEFPDFQVQSKDGSRFMRLLGWILKTITFGKNTSFMKDFVTTIGHTVYVPAKWEAWPEKNKISILRHERVHMRQQKRYGRLRFSLLYLFAGPAVFAYYRTRFEQEAYTESMRAMLELYGPQQLLNLKVREHMVSTFTGPDYFWMWVKRKDIEDWYDKTVQLVLNEKSSS